MAVNYWRQTNLNEHIRFKLTAKGEKIWRDYWEPYCDGRDALLTIPPDADGWRQEQLWTFAGVFGPHFQSGFDPPVETIIQVETNE